MRYVNMDERPSTKSNGGSRESSASLEAIPRKRFMRTPWLALALTELMTSAIRERYLVKASSAKMAAA